MASTVIGCLSTLRHTDGRISTNPVSYRWNGAEIEISTLKERMKYKNMVADPRATLCVVSPRDPMHYVELIYLTPEQVSSPLLYGGQFDDFGEKFNS